MSSDDDKKINSWHEFRRLVMYRLDTHEESTKRVHSCLISIKSDLAAMKVQMSNTAARQQELVKDQARRTSRSWGAVAGIAASVAVAFITRLIPFR